MNPATASAEPLGGAARVKSASCGLVVGPGWRLANSVLPVLPIRNSALLPRAKRSAGIVGWPPPSIIVRTGAGRLHIGVSKMSLRAHAALRSVGLFFPARSNAARLRTRARPRDSFHARTTVRASWHRSSTHEPTASAVRSPSAISEPKQWPARRCSSALQSPEFRSAAVSAI